MGDKAGDALDLEIIPEYRNDSDFGESMASCFPERGRQTALGSSFADQDTCAGVSFNDRSYSEVGQDEDPGDYRRIPVGGSPPNLGLSLCTVLSENGHEDNEERSCADGEHSCSVVAENSSGVSANNLFDGTSTSTVGPVKIETHNGSDFEGSAASCYLEGGRQTALVSSFAYQDAKAWGADFGARSFDDIGQDENPRYYPDSSYPSFFTDDEMIESTPGGYLPATSSIYSPYPSSGSATRGVYLSKAALYHHHHQCSKRISSECPSDALPSNATEGDGTSTVASDLEVEDDELQVADHSRQPGNTRKHRDHTGHLGKLHPFNTPFTCTASVILSSDNISDNYPPCSFSSSTSTVASDLEVSGRVQ